MIPLTLPDLFLWLLLVHLGLVLAVTLYYSLRGIRVMPRRRAAPFIFRCASCAHVYLDRRNVPMAECDKCGHMNESVKSF